MRPDGVVVDTPLLDQDLGLTQAAEQFAIEQLVPEPSIEAFDVAVLPRAAWLDEGGLGTDSRDPLPNGLGDELRPIARREEALF